MSRLREDSTAPTPVAVRDGDDATTRTRNRLLDAVIHIAGTRGVDKVTYRSVGARAGLSHSLVRFHFGSREAMVTRALERAARLDASESQLLSDDIDTFSSGMVRAISTNRSRGMVQYDYLLRAVRGGAPTEHVTGLYDLCIGQVSGTLENIGIDDSDGSRAALILAALDGLVLQHAIYRSDERTEAMLGSLRGMLRLLQSRDESPP
ncbi:TetR/AcrR family transcriptional regulator [Streptomyces sp. NPDC057236]|uniref:TetR/AcrR family transcriptional regulator n=1 Tax=Streptomyces sp. NPDC057236 TaxID=3346059 RepID=UPI0036412090